MPARGGCSVIKVALYRSVLKNTMDRGITSVRRSLHHLTYFINHQFFSINQARERSPFWTSIEFSERGVFPFMLLGFLAFQEPQFIRNSGMPYRKDLLREANASDSSMQCTPQFQPAQMVSVPVCRY